MSRGGGGGPMPSAGLQAVCGPGNSHLPLSRPPAAQAQPWLCGCSPKSRLTTASPSFWAGTREGRCVPQSLSLLTSQVTLLGLFAPPEHQLPYL